MEFLENAGKFCLNDRIVECKNEGIMECWNVGIVEWRNGGKMN
jgi:hypothetical protein